MPKLKSTQLKIGFLQFLLFSFGPLLPFWFIFQSLSFLLSLSSSFEDFFFASVLFISPIYLGSVAYRIFRRYQNVWVRFISLYIAWVFLSFVLGWTMVHLFAGASMAVADGGVTAAQIELMAISFGESCVFKGHFLFVPWIGAMLCCRKFKGTLQSP